MRLTPDRPALRRWRLWVGAVLVAEICWFALLHPRIAGNFRTLLALALLPLTVVGYVYLMAAVSAYLADREWDLRLRQMIVIMLGLSVGSFVFAVLWLTKNSVALPHRSCNLRAPVWNLSLPNGDKRIHR